MRCLKRAFGLSVAVEPRPRKPGIPIPPGAARASSFLAFSKAKVNAVYCDDGWGDGSFSCAVADPLSSKRGFRPGRTAAWMAAKARVLRSRVKEYYVFAGKAFTVAKLWVQILMQGALRH